MDPDWARAMAPGFSGPASIALRRSRRARLRSASVLSLPRRTSSSRAVVSSTVAGTPKSASINTRSMFSRSSALSPRMSAPTSVSATCLIRDHRLCFSLLPSLLGFIHSSSRWCAGLFARDPSGIYHLSEVRDAGEPAIRQRVPGRRFRTARANYGPWCAQSSERPVPRVQSG